MSNRLFAATGAVWHCGPKRVKRTWGRTVVGLLVMLALSALAGWLLTLLRHGAGISHCVTSSGMMLAMAPVPLAVASPAMQALVIGLLMFFSAAGVVLVMWRSRVDAEARMRWAVVDERPEGRDLASPAPCEDPLALPEMGMPREDLRRILASLTAETAAAMNLTAQMRQVWAAEKKVIHCPNCGVLAGALPNLDAGLKANETRLHGVLVCLGGLAARAAKEPPISPCISDCVILAGKMRLNVTLALAGDKRKLTELSTMAELLQARLLQMNGAPPEGQAWEEKMGGSAS